MPHFGTQIEKRGTNTKTHHKTIPAAGEYTKPSDREPIKRTYYGAGMLFGPTPFICSALMMPIKKWNFN